MSDLRRIEPGTNPGGLYRRLICDGSMLASGPISSFTEANDLAELDARLTDEQRGRVWLYLYDGDTGECMMTGIVPPKIPAVDDRAPEVIHLAGAAITMSAHLRQRCEWCGYVLIDADLTRIAVAICNEPLGDNGERCRLNPGHGGDHSPLTTPEVSTWEPGSFVGIYDTGGFRASRAVEPEDPAKAPEGSCLLLPPEMTLNVTSET